MRAWQQPAFVLHASQYGETSLLLEVFTRNHGRIGLIAKGARRTKSGMRALLSPFMPLVINWSGKGELPTLNGAESDGNAIGLAGEALFCGFYMNELMVRLLHRYDPHDSLYDRYRAALPGLQDSARMAPTLRIFEKHLLQELGYGLLLEREAESGSPVEPGVAYDYLPERGPVRAGAPEPGSVRLQGASLLALANEQFTDNRSLRESKNLMRACLARHLGDRPLHSRKLFRATQTDTEAETTEDGHNR